MTHLYSFLPNGGEMGQRIREANWSDNILGAPQFWPDSLKSAASICLNSGYPVAIYWGEQFTLLYNDEWSSLAGNKHPWALGKAGELVWPEIWRDLEFHLKDVLNKGESVRQPDALLLMERNGYREECYFDYTLSPIIDADGRIGGVFNAVTETTYKVINERRNKVHIDFLKNLGSASSIDDSIFCIRTILSEATEDIPFSFICVNSSDFSTKLEDLSVEGTLSEEATQVKWPLPGLNGEGTHHVEDLRVYLSQPILSKHGEECIEAFITPITYGNMNVTGYILFGISPRKRLDDEYKRFLETVSLNAGTLINNAYSRNQIFRLEREQALNEELAAANEELSVINEELHQTQQNLFALNNELEDRVRIRTQDLALSESRFRRMIEQAPAAMAVFRGDDLTISLANTPALELAEKTSEIINKPLLEALPEVKEQPIYEILYNVYRSGTAFKGYEIPVTLNKKGIMETGYYNVSYTPMYEEEKIVGVLQVSYDVTSQVLSKKKIEESESSLRSLIETAPYALMLLKGQELRIELANQEIATLWDRPLGEIKGRTLMEVLPELEDQPFPRLLKEVYDTKKPYRQEEEVFYVNTNNGPATKYVSFSYNPLLNNEGESIGIIVAANDITALVESRNMLEASYEEQQALNEEVTATNEELAAANEELLSTNEELARIRQHLEETVHKLADKEARIRFMVADAPVAIGVLTGKELIIESANKQILELWGKTDVIVGQPLIVALPELEGQPFLQILNDVMSTGNAFRGNEVKAYLERKGNLEECYFNFVYHPLKDDNEATFSIMVVAIDVTQQVAARRHIEESEKRFKFMLNAIPQQVWTAKPSGELDYVNEIVCKDFGYTVDEVVGHGWQKFIHPEDLPDCLENWTKSLQSGERYMYEFRLRMANGEYVWHLAQAVPYIENNEITLWLGTNTNIDLQKRNDQKKDEFLSIASHELKTPLTSIKAFNQLIQRTKDTSKLGNFIQKSAEHIFRLEKLINDLLDVTKINAGKMIYNIEPFSFLKMLTNSIESVQHTAIKHKIELEASEDVIFKGDQLRLEQVMHNFLTNAMKYSPDADKVTVNYKVEQDNIIVAVQDFGIGIAEDHLDRLFDRYYRVDNTAMRFEGLGLGLFISSEILKRHKGSFWIESELGKGSTFYFRLPLQPEKEQIPLILDENYYQDPSITIKHNQKQNCLEVDWIGFHDLDSVQKGCLKMLEMLKKHKCDKVLNDNSNVRGTWSEASDWVGKEWFPLMEQAGLKYFAWIFSNSSFSQMSAKKSIDVKMGNVITQFFTDISLADRWLCNSGCLSKMQGGDLTLEKDLLQ
ncbi:PAS domain-containing protein [Desertivirga brevis]|uniref:PAS domain-containing protein n=1 Tax=Desertivirga brevis TaxID=2810310 RepID=UPI001A958ECF|nr:PAS domain-containing protein [Pedobacter sp. SYSU D00873]